MTDKVILLKAHRMYLESVLVRTQKNKEKAQQLLNMLTSSSEFDILLISSPFPTNAELLEECKVVLKSYQEFEKSVKKSIVEIEMEYFKASWAARHDQDVAKTLTRMDNDGHEDDNSGENGSSKNH